MSLTVRLVLLAVCLYLFVPAGKAYRSFCLKRAGSLPGRTQRRVMTGFRVTAAAAFLFYAGFLVVVFLLLLEPGRQPDLTDTVLILLLPGCCAVTVLVYDSALRQLTRSSAAVRHAVPAKGKASCTADRQDPFEEELDEEEFMEDIRSIDQH